MTANDNEVLRMDEEMGHVLVLRIPDEIVLHVDTRTMRLERPSALPTGAPMAAATKPRITVDTNPKCFILTELVNALVSSREAKVDGRGKTTRLVSTSMPHDFILGR